MKKTIEEKAKAYDEAIERAKYYYNEGKTLEYADDIASDIFPELAESEDEKIRKEIINYLEPQGDCCGNKERWIAWLEKQGEQKSIWHNEDEEPQRGSLILLIMQSGTPIVAKIIEPNHTFNHGERWAYIDDLLEKQGEHKSADKVEPKFHKGEWITNGDYTWKIVEVKPLDYILQSQEGNIVDDTISHVDEQFHSFTIKDAKDGDVLVFKNNIGGIIICKSPSDYDTRSYCRLTRDNLINKEESGWASTLLVPATKEQRDLLFQKMKEAGYEWDAEKLELKLLITNGGDFCEVENCEKKPAWSEEDEDYYDAIIAKLEVTQDDAALTDSQMEFLKSLKQRYTWKPSEEQMRALHDMNLTGNISYAGQGQTLIELYNDLKKL